MQTQYSLDGSGRILRSAQFIAQFYRCAARLQSIVRTFRVIEVLLTLGRYYEQFTTECLLFDIFGRIDICWCVSLAFGDAASVRLAARGPCRIGEELLRAAQRWPIRRDWFLYDLLGLRLEDFQPNAGAPSHLQVTLRLTRGGAVISRQNNPEGAVLVLEDVVLPLRNLTAYLHAMVDRAVPQLGAQASKMTARQID